MEKLIEELRGFVSFKDTTECGDVVLIAAKEPQMLFYAYVTNIERDTSRKDEWWHVSMHILSFPPQKITWTLRTPQMTGLEIFTMGGEERFFKAVDFEVIKVPETESLKEKEKGTDKGFIKRIK